MTTVSFNNDKSSFLNVDVGVFGTESICLFSPLENHSPGSSGHWLLTLPIHTMHILVINCGSSSIKADVLDPVTGVRSLSIRVQRITSDSPVLRFSDEDSDRICPETGHEAALKMMFETMIEKSLPFTIEGIGHRVVHGGAEFTSPTLIDEKVEKAIQALNPLAPLHNPINLLGVKIAKKYHPNLAHVAVFDTAFHCTLPRRAQAYALPSAVTKKHGFRRYGFHGTSHEYVAQQAAEFLGQDLRALRLITCHLGSGCSIAAVEYGRSVETSMGMTPLEGLVMGSRPGDVDPGILLDWMRKDGISIDELDRQLNKESGLKGMSGQGNDMRDIIARASEGDDDCRMALQVFTHRIRKYIGAYAAVMGGVDAIIFTAGIGENSPIIRHRCTQRLDFLGARIDEDKNRSLSVSEDNPVAAFSLPHSQTTLLTVATNEQLSIARHAYDLIYGRDKVQAPKTIPVAVSARHIHLTQESVDVLFGKGYQLTEYKPLSQPGQFAANERVTVVGPRNRIEKVRILGPTRSKNQIEISRTDEFKLGIDAPVRGSGHTKNSPGCTLIGPEGTLELKEGVICAWRHIHMTPDDAIQFGVEDKDIVEVEVQSEDRSLTFGNVLVRVSPKYLLEMHIDTDEGNAAEISRGAVGVLSGAVGDAVLRKRVI